MKIRLLEDHAIVVDEVIESSFADVSPFHWYKANGDHTNTVYSAYLWEPVPEEWVDVTSECELYDPGLDTFRLYHKGYHVGFKKHEGAYRVTGWPTVKVERKVS